MRDDTYDLRLITRREWRVEVPKWATPVDPERGKQGYAGVNQRY
jgi:hypothetical protein